MFRNELNPSWKVAIIARNTPKTHTQATRQQRLSLGPRHAHARHYFSLKGQEAANHVLPQPCRRRCALRFLGQCLHVSFSDTASTDAIYLCACLEGASRPSSLSPRGRPRGDDIIGLSKNDSELWATGSMLWTNAETDCCRVACPCIHEPSLTPLLIVPFFIFTKFCTCSVTPGSRGLAGAVNTRAPAVPALRMADVADATEAAADPTVMRPPIDMPWESISDQVRRGHLIAAPSIELCNSRNSGMLLRYPHTS